jgi:hypothetical protein
MLLIMSCLNIVNRFAQGVHRQCPYKHGDYATVESGVLRAKPRLAQPVTKRQL